jgi:hypothetical protein
MDLGVLYPGMTADEAVEILGSPTTRRIPVVDRNAPTSVDAKESSHHMQDGLLRWHLVSPRHVNPVLTAEIRDGKVVRFGGGKG